MIVIRDFSIFSTIMLIIAMFSFMVGIVYISIRMTDDYIENRKISLLKAFNKISVACIIICIISAVLFQINYNKKVEKNIEFIKGLDFIQVEKVNDTDGSDLYFSDEFGDIYRYHANSKIDINSNVNTTEYSIEFLENNKVMVNVPWTYEALDFAKTSLWSFMFPYPLLGCVMLIFLFDLILGTFLLFENIGYEGPFLDKCSNLIIVMLFLIITIGSPIVTIAGTPKIREQNMENINQMEIVQNDFNNNIYCADENGDLYIYSKYELPVDFHYNINFKDFIILEDNINMPFRKRSTTFEN